MLENELVITAVNEFGGDLNLAAKALKVSRVKLCQFISGDPKLVAAFGVSAGVPESAPGETERLVRDANDIIPHHPDKETIQAIQTQNVDLIGEGLLKNGIKPETLEKMKNLGEFEQNAGKFLVGSLDIMLRLVVYTGVSLFEVTEEIKEILQDKTLEPHARLAWLRAYNVTVDQMQKSYDRVVTGTVGMAKVTRPDDDKGTKTKPGFTPLPPQSLDGKAS